MTARTATVVFATNTDELVRLKLHFAVTSASLIHIASVYIVLCVFIFGCGSDLPALASGYSRLT